MKLKGIAVILFTMLLGVSNVSAKEWTPLKRGDVFERPAEGFTVPAIRRAIERRGYITLGKANKFGQLRDFIAFGPENRRYRISVNYRTGKVVKVKRYVQ